MSLTINSRFGFRDMTIQQEEEEEEEEEEEKKI
jgi:hypothetical protein